MPSWLKRQIKHAFLEKDRYRIRLLNDCWFYYQKNTSGQTWKIPRYKGENEFLPR